jgi:peptidoglycan/xylan/chitin deacetylase (PgdA/CDA1 family)
LFSDTKSKPKPFGKNAMKKAAFLIGLILCAVIAFVKIRRTDLPGGGSQQHSNAQFPRPVATTPVDKRHFVPDTMTLADFDTPENWNPSEGTTIRYDNNGYITASAPWGGTAQLTKRFEHPLDLRRRHFGLRYKTPLLNRDIPRSRFFSEIKSRFDLSTYFHFQWEFYVSFISANGSTKLRLDPADQVDGWFMLPFSNESVFMNGGSVVNGGVDWSAVKATTIEFQGKDIPFSTTDVHIRDNTIAIKDSCCMVAAVIHTGAPVRFVGKTLPAPLQEGRTYYAISHDVAVHTFRFSETATGAPVTIADAGAGDMRVVTAPEIAFDKLVAVTSDSKAYIVLRFDDSFQTTHTIAKPIMDRYGFKGVFSVVTDNNQAAASPTGNPEFCVDCGDNEFVTWRTLDVMRDDGWDIVSHTHNHAPLGDLYEQGGAQPQPPMHTGVWTENDVRFQLGQSKRELLIHGHNNGARFVVYTYGPSSAFSHYANKLVPEYYALGSHAVPFGITPLPLINPYYFGVLPVEHDDRFEGGNTQKAIDRVCEQGGLLVLLSHKINKHSRSQAVFENLIDYIAGKKGDWLIHMLHKIYARPRSQTFVEDMIDYIARKQQTHNNPPRVITFSQLYDNIIGPAQGSPPPQAWQQEPFFPVAHYWYDITLTMADSFTTILLDARSSNLQITLPPLSEYSGRELKMTASNVTKHTITIHASGNDAILLNGKRVTSTSGASLLKTAGDRLWLVGDRDKGVWRITLMN